MVLARGLFLLLLLANLIFFAWTQGYFGATDGEGREPQRLDSQLAPEKIHLVAETAKAVPAAAPCRAVTPLPSDQAARLKAGLAELGPEIAVSEVAVRVPQSFWVYIPALPDSQAAEKKAAELKKLGVTDFYVVQDEGADRNAISLALFKSDQAAREFLAVLAKKGVRSATVKERDKEAEKATLELRGPAERLGAAPVAELVAKAGATLTECAAHP